MKKLINCACKCQLDLEWLKINNCFFSQSRSYGKGILSISEHLRLKACFTHHGAQTNSSKCHCECCHGHRPEVKNLGIHVYWWQSLGCQEKIKTIQEEQHWFVHNMRLHTSFIMIWSLRPVWMPLIKNTTIITNWVLQTKLWYLYFTIEISFKNCTCLISQVLNQCLTTGKNLVNQRKIEWYHTPDVMTTDWNLSNTGLIAMEASIQLRGKEEERLGSKMYSWTWSEIKIVLDSVRKFTVKENQKIAWIESSIAVVKRPDHNRGKLENHLPEM